MAVTRRNIIAGAAILPAAALRGSAANSAVTVGLIGAGGRGTLDARHLVAHTGARVTALCDIQEERLARARTSIPAPDAKTYHDYRDVLASGVDAVIIATPVFLHPEHLEAAVKAGKHIYIEKPAGVDVEGCKRVMRIADAADRKLNLTFGFQQRYGPATRKAQELVASGAIGKLRLAHSHFIKGAVQENEPPRPRPATERERSIRWQDWSDTHGDYIVETYCHGIDILNWFCGGHPVKASGAGGRIVTTRGDLHDHVTVTYSYPSGVQATLTGTQVAPAFYRDAHETFWGADAVIETSRDWYRLHRSTRNTTEEREPRDITIDAMQAFIQRIQDGKPENVGVRGAESTLTAILGRMAMQRKREVTWDEMMGG